MRECKNYCEELKVEFDLRIKKLGLLGGKNSLVRENPLFVKCNQKLTKCQKNFFVMLVKLGSDFV